MESLAKPADRAAASDECLPVDGCLDECLLPVDERLAAAEKRVPAQAPVAPSEDDDADNEGESMEESDDMLVVKR